MKQWNSPLGLPHWDFDSQVAVKGDGQQRQDGALREDQHRAGDQQTAVEVRLQPDADGDGEGDDQSPHCNVGQGQGHDEAEGGVPQDAVDAHRPDHHHVPDDRGDRDQHLHSDVDSQRGGEIRRHARGCWLSARSAPTRRGSSRFHFVGIR